MIDLDVADLVLIAGSALGIGPDEALARLDPAALDAALADAGISGARSAHTVTAAVGPGDPADAAQAAAALVRALLVHRPFGSDGARLATAAGLQMLALNGWRADLEPPQTAAVVIEALGSGRLDPQAAADWLAPRLARVPPPTVEEEPVPTPAPQWAVSAPGARRPARTRPGSVPRAAGRRLAGTLAALALASLAVLAAACSDQQGTGVHPAPSHPASPCATAGAAC
ncbi:hypothetical protein KDL01_16360 [Actinospica durhamensis]|uniref:Uncharacterized protein n=1 Tax=Actinospica durhamensis TaxID=1508375 RepID=A0A941EQW1_9ACTN|nr:hypothetical protein [Actinospica durhamensis]MBR7834847.1 hypothetical protein [Actinospica durhamensis]